MREYETERRSVSTSAVVLPGKAKYFGLLLFSLSLLFFLYESFPLLNGKVASGYSKILTLPHYSRGGKSPPRSLC